MATFQKNYEREMTELMSTSDGSEIISDKIYFGEDGAEIYKINPHFEKFIIKNYVVETTNTIDLEWVKESYKYVESLPPVEQFMLAGYSTYGDNIVNTYLRFGKERVIKLPYFRNIFEHKYPIAKQIFDLKDLSCSDYIEKTRSKVYTVTNSGVEKLTEIIASLTDDDIINCINKYIIELRNIIIGSPRLKKPMRVYRGVQQDYLVEGDNTKLIGFISTTFDTGDTLSYFTKNKSSACIYSTTILKDTPCITLDPVSPHNECEILIIDNVYASISPLKINLKFNEMKLINPYNEDDEAELYFIRNIVIGSGAASGGAASGGGASQRRKKRTTRKRRFAQFI